MKDYDAVIKKVMEDLKGKREVVVIGHSVGGHIVPLVEDDLRKSVKRYVFVGATNPHEKTTPTPKGIRAWHQV